MRGEDGVALVLPEGHCVVPDPVSAGEVEAHRELGFEVDHRRARTPPEGRGVVTDWRVGYREEPAGCDSLRHA